MIDKIILDIHHSDDYTDYLFMTAALTNRRVVPLVGADLDTIRKQSDRHTLTLHCHNSRKELRAGERTVTVDTLTQSIRVLSRIYLDDDGAIEYSQAEIVRSLIQDAVENILFSPRNLNELYRQYFPLFWANRQRIYDNPQLFFASTGRYAYRIDEYMPLGAVLKAMEEEEGTFRLKLGGGCNCMEKPFLVDYSSEYEQGSGHIWTLYTWCPACHAKREIKAEYFQRSTECDLAVERARARYDKGQGVSKLTLFDVLDALRST